MSLRSNTSNGGKLQAALQKWALALQKQGGFSEMQEQKVQEQLVNLENFKKNLELSSGHTPSVLIFFLKPMYAIAMVYYNLQKWFIKRVDFTQGTWEQMSKTKKVTVSLRIFTAIVVLLCWGVVMRVLNALILSMNSFVTLGYGEIQAKGLSRYLAVLEGVLGWMVLTIFSASLITQLMS